MFLFLTVSLRKLITRELCFDTSKAFSNYLFLSGLDSEGLELNAIWYMILFKMCDYKTYGKVFQMKRLR